MRPVSVWLERFRRPAGVPAGASEELDSELMPVFATLDEIEEEAQMLYSEAQREATRRLEAASREAELVLTRWTRQAEVERVRAETERREAVTSEVHSIEADAAAEAERIRQDGLERIPALVASLIACVEGDDS